MVARGCMVISNACLRNCFPLKKIMSSVFMSMDLAKVALMCCR